MKVNLGVDVIVVHPIKCFYCPYNNGTQDKQGEIFSSLQAKAGDGILKTSKFIFSLANPVDFTKVNRNIIYRITSREVVPGSNFTCRTPVVKTIKVV